MTGRPSFPSLPESFFRHRMAKQRNATPATIASYRDVLRMLILFAADRASCGPFAAPDQRTARGRRDRALLLFLGRTGARVSEALGVNVGDLQLGRPRPQMLLHGEGRRERVLPVSADLAEPSKP